MDGWKEPYIDTVHRVVAMVRLKRQGDTQGLLARGEELGGAGPEVVLATIGSLVDLVILAMNQFVTPQDPEVWLTNVLSNVDLEALDPDHNQEWNEIRETDS